MLLDSLRVITCRFMDFSGYGAFSSTIVVVLGAYRPHVMYKAPGVLFFWGGGEVFKYFCTKPLY